MHARFFLSLYNIRVSAKKYGVEIDLPSRHCCTRHVYPATFYFFGEGIFLRKSTFFWRGEGVAAYVIIMHIVNWLLVSFFVGGGNAQIWAGQLSLSPRSCVPAVAQFGNSLMTRWRLCNTALTQTLMYDLSECRTKAHRTKAHRTEAHRTKAHEDISP